MAQAQAGLHAHHEYELYRAIKNHGFAVSEDVDHPKTKAKSPQASSICERFHRTMLAKLYEEFSQVAFRKKVYESLEALPADADNWIRSYNEERPHRGHYCSGKTPMQTFLDARYCDAKYWKFRKKLLTA